MCFGCFIPGHIQAQCKSRPKCIRCGQRKDNENEICPKLNGPPRCANCKGDHLPTDKKCPAFAHEPAIRRIAGDRNISHNEARAILSNSAPAFSLSNARFLALSNSTNSSHSAAPPPSTASSCPVSFSQVTAARPTVPQNHPNSSGTHQHGQNRNVSSNCYRGPGTTFSESPLVQAPLPQHFAAHQCTPAAHRPPIPSPISARTQATRAKVRHCFKLYR